MAESTLTSWVIKLLWVPVIGPILVWLVKRVVSDVYTKGEVDNRIDLKLRPLEDKVWQLNRSLDRNTEALERLADSISHLDKRLAVEEARRKLGGL